MTQEIRPSRKVVLENVNLDVVTYQCINCGASLDGASGKCRFCDTNYVLEASTPMQADDGVWIRVKPNFPDRLMGGALRDNKKEAQIEANIFSKIENFYAGEVGRVGKEQTEAFLRLLVVAASKNGVSIRGGFGEGSILNFIKKEAHEITSNQSNILRLLPELIERGDLWSDLVSMAFDKKSGFSVDLFESMKKNLEKSLGYWVRYDGGVSIGSETKAEQTSKPSEKKKNWFMAMFGKNRSDE